MMQRYYFILFKSAFFLMLLCLSVEKGESQVQNQYFLGVSKQEIKHELEVLLSNYYPGIIDTINGGYWTNFEYNWTLSKDQRKMLVTQARGLWTAAHAAMEFPENPVFRKAADHGYKFLTEHMWDTQNAGFFLYYLDGSHTVPGINYKLTYGNAFALYALAEYAKINTDPAVLAWVKKSFQWLEDVAHDPTYLGYYNLILPDGIKASKDATTQAAVWQLGWGDPQWKDQNTSIHILEALTNTYEVLPEASVKKRLAEMLRLVRDTMVHPDGYLHLNFTKNWQPISYRDSSRAYILQHLQYDHISFGHNIETAYLLLDAAKALYRKYDSKTLRVARKMVDHSLAHGFDKNYYGLFDRGYQFAEKGPIEIVGNQKTWWSQAEAWHALAMMALIYPKEPKYAEAFRQMWKYIQNEMIDHDQGGWYNNGLDTDPKNKTTRKAHEWKGCYHDGRALMQVLSYAK